MAENRHTERTLDALLEQARGIAQMAAERTQAIDQQRRLPDDLMTPHERVRGLAPHPTASPLGRL